MVRQIREVLTNQNTDSVDFVQDFKMSFLAKEISVYTPKGDVKMLPIGSTAFDFAFSIHSAAGTKCIGTKINHKLVPRGYKLRTGNQVEIITSNKQKPSEKMERKIGKYPNVTEYYIEKNRLFYLCCTKDQKSPGQTHKFYIGSSLNYEHLFC